MFSGPSHDDYSSDSRSLTGFQLGFSGQLKKYLQSSYMCNYHA